MSSGHRFYWLLHVSLIDLSHAFWIPHPEEQWCLLSRSELRRTEREFINVKLKGESKRTSTRDIEHNTTGTEYVHFH